MTRQIKSSDIDRVAGIPEPTTDPSQLYATVIALKMAVEVLSRQTRNFEQSSARLAELERLGLLTTHSDGTISSDILDRIEALE